MSVVYLSLWRCILSWYPLGIFFHTNLSSLTQTNREPAERQNVYLKQLREELYEAYTAGSLDAFGLYVYGLVLKESPAGGHFPAHVILTESLLEYPWNWSAWLDLAELCIANPDLHAIVEKAFLKLHNHYMYCFFCSHVLLEDQQHDKAIIVLEKLLHPDAASSEETSTTLFQSPYVACKTAVAYYHLREFEVAQELFVSLLEKDPHRLEDMDVYSNILYVKEDAVALSQLAHTVTKVDKYRPETCVIVGNYYSLKTQRTRAIQYFQRALKLNRNYTSAWTLMGHEYVELKVSCRVYVRMACELSVTVAMTIDVCSLAPPSDDDHCSPDSFTSSFIHRTLRPLWKPTERLSMSIPRTFERGTVWAKRTSFFKCISTHCFTTRKRHPSVRTMLACGVPWVVLTLDWDESRMPFEPTNVPFLILTLRESLLKSWRHSIVKTDRKKRRHNATCDIWNYVIKLLLRIRPISNSSLFSMASSSMPPRQKPCCFLQAITRIIRSTRLPPFVAVVCWNGKGPKRKKARRCSEKFDRVVNDLALPNRHDASVARSNSKISCPFCSVVVAPPPFPLLVLGLVLNH